MPRPFSVHCQDWSQCPYLQEEPARRLSLWPRTESLAALMFSIVCLFVVALFVLLLIVFYFLVCCLFFCDLISVITNHSIVFTTLNPGTYESNDARPLLQNGEYPNYFISIFFYWYFCLYRYDCLWLSHTSAMVPVWWQFVSAKRLWYHRHILCLI